MSESNALIVPVLSLLGGAAGGIFGGFFAKRGEIAAIHSQLDKVVEQNSRLTKEAEEIKRQVSGRQRIWVIKREAAHNLAELFGTTSSILADLVGSASSFSTATGPGQKDLSRKNLIAAVKRLMKAVERMWQIEGVMSLWFDPQTVKPIGDATVYGADNEACTQTRNSRARADGASQHPT